MVTQGDGTVAQIVSRMEGIETHAASGGTESDSGYKEDPDLKAPESETEDLDSGSTGRQVGRPRVERARAGKGCGCPTILEKLYHHFRSALRSSLETKRLRKMNGGTEPGRYNYARLNSVAIDTLFDKAGNFVVHRTCAAQKLYLSKTCLTRIHAKAIRVRNAPILTEPRSSIAPCDTEVTEHVVLPEDFLLSVAKYLSSLSSSDSVYLVADRKKTHGLCGKRSNNEKSAAQNFFKVFVRKHSSPNGRTADANGRYHGATGHLDAKFRIFIKKKKNERRLAFADEVVAAMKRYVYFVAHPEAVISPRTARVWLQEMFGKTLLVDGRVTYNPEYTTL